ncbi:hypothetical protein C8A05DRAFT_16511, partial [Staphylotrichum tortipilum]
LLRLRDYVTGPLPFELPLLTETAGNRRLHCILKIGGHLSTPVAADPKDRPSQPAANETETENLKILELAVDDRIADKHADNDGTAPPLPAYLMPLGDVYAVNRGSNNAQEVSSTNFYVLLDITTPNKGVWLIYRYQRPVERAGGANWENVKGLESQAFFTRGRGKRAFDTMCLLTRVAEWESPVEDMVKAGMGCFANESVGEGRGG